MGTLRNHDVSPFLTVPEIAKKLRVPIRTVRKHAAEWPFMRRIPGTREWRAHCEDVVAFVRTGKVDGRRGEG